MCSSDLDTNWYNPLPYSPSQEQVNLCLGNNCIVGWYTKTNAYDIAGCFTKVPTGLRAKAVIDCETGKGTLISPDTEYPYLCTALPPGTNPNDFACNDIEHSIASPVLEMFTDFSCKTAYYMTIFGGALIVLIVFAAL